MKSRTQTLLSFILALIWLGATMTSTAYAKKPVPVTAQQPLTSSAKRVSVQTPKLGIKDLRLTSGSVMQGEKLGVSFKVENSGTITSGAFQLKVCVSSTPGGERNFSSVSPRVSTVARRSGLEAGQEYRYTKRTNFTFTEDAPVGNRYVVVKLLNSSGKTLLTESAPFELTAAPKPDLNVQILSVSPDRPLPGESVQVEMVIRNRSREREAKGYWTTLCFKENGSAPVGCHGWAGRRLQPNGEYRKALSFRIPQNASPGMQQLVASVDTKDEIVEANERNNSAYASVSVMSNEGLPDLQVSSMTVSPTEIVRGQSVRIRSRVDYNGRIPRQNRVRAGLYYSVNRFFDSRDRLLSNARRGNGTSEYFNFEYTLTPQQTAEMRLGRGYLICVADPDNAIAEKNMNNNKAVIEITVEEPPKPDLTVQELRVVPRTIPQRESVEVSAVIDFGMEIDSSINVYEELYFSKDTTLSEDDTRLIGSGRGQRNRQRYSYTKTLASYHTKDLPIGRGYFIAIADPKNQVDEASENNNIKIVPVRITGPLLPDVMIESIRPNPAELAVGDRLQVSFTLKNVGTKPLSDSLKVAVYLSKDDRIDSQDQRLLSDMAPLRFRRPLEPGKKFTYGSRSFPLPDVGHLIGQKRYYLLVQVDPDNEVEEVRVSNNFKSQSLLIGRKVRVAK